MRTLRMSIDGRIKKRQICLLSLHRGGDCKKDWVREEKLDKVFLDLIKKIPNPDSGLFDMIRKGIKETRKLKNEYEETSTEAIQKQIEILKRRIDNLYADKLDGKITEEFWKEKHNIWYSERDELLEKLKGFNSAARTFDEGTNLLENFCKCKETHKRRLD